MWVCDWGEHWMPDTDLHVGVVCLIKYSGLSSVRATSGHALVKG